MAKAKKSLLDVIGNQPVLLSTGMSHGTFEEKQKLRMWFINL